MHEYETAKMLLEIGAVSVRPNDPYRLESGILSPIHIDIPTLHSSPGQRDTVIDAFRDGIDSSVGRNNLDLVVGVGPTGAAMAAFLVEKLRIPMAYIRASAKGHGKENRIEGLIPEGSRALLISDVIDDSSFIPRSVDLLRERGVEIVLVLSLFDFRLGVVDRYLDEKGIRLFALSDLPMLLKTAAAEKLISPLERDDIERWMEQHRSWGDSRMQALPEEARQRAEAAARTLLEIGAVTLSPSDPYRYASGILSPIYCDNRLLLSYPEEWRKIIDAMVNIIVNVIGKENFDIIGGTSTAGIPHAACIADRLHKPMISIKGAAEEHGKRTKIEGRLPAGSRVLVIEDLVSTGGSSIQAVQSIRDAGGTVEHCLAIFTYEMEKSARAFRDADCTLHTLTRFSVLIREARKRGTVSPEEAEKSIEWNTAPEAWGRKMGYE